MARWWPRAIGIVLALAGMVSICAAQAPAVFGPPTDRLIVKFRGEADDANPRPIDPAKLESLSVRAGVPLTYRRAKSGGAHVLSLDRARALPEVEAIAKRLRADPDIVYAVPSRIAYPQLVPDDTLYPQQWYLQAPASGGINLPGAWDLTTGMAAITVAVVDTGVLLHADLAGRLLPGYDFVKADRSNDGDGRDAIATDPGDGVTGAEASAVCPATPSSWHGTRLAGIIAAASGNAAGIAGINWNSKILPVRAIGKCGGYSEDIIDGIRWAAGLSVPGVPINTTPARVINLSLVTFGFCDPAFQSAIDDATNAGAVVVVAAGNQALNSDNFTPVSCGNVIAVGAVDRHGGLAPYSNTGLEITVSAPGGDRANPADAALSILSTSDSGTLTLGPANDNVYQSSYGTSLAAAQVSGVASLMLSQNPTLTPAQVGDLLASTARTFPAGTAVLGSYADCSPPICGAGIVDAALAVAAASVTTSTAMAQAASDGRGAVAVRADGTVWRWGSMYPSFYSASPERLGEINGVKQVQMGGGMILLLRSDGTVWAVGPNASGQLGDGTFTDRIAPVQVKGPAGVGLLTNVKAIAAGGNFALALKLDSTVWAWGGTFGPTPQQVGGNVIEIAAGLGHALFVQSDGTVLAAGDNSSGQLGDGTTATRFTAAPVVGAGGTGFLSGVTKVVAGPKHSLALKSNGTAWAWGYNFNGQLGDGTTTQRTTPVQVSGLGNVQALAAGWSHSLALKSDGTVWAWGLSPANGRDTQVLAPMAIAGVNAALAIAAGGDGSFSTSYALMTDGTLRAWGTNIFGQLGDGAAAATTRTAPAPVLASAGGSPFGFGTGDPVNFVPRLDAPPGTQVSANTIILTGIGTGVPISVSGGQFSVNGAAFTAAAGFVNNGDTVTLRQTSSAGYGSTTTATLVVGAAGRVFKVSTIAAADGAAETLDFPPKAGNQVLLGQPTVSDTLVVNGINVPVAISVIGGEYSIDGGAFTSAPGTVSNGQRLQLRLLSSSAYDTLTTASLTVGGQASAFHVITPPAPGFAVFPQVASDGQTSVMLRADGTLWRTGLIFGSASADGSSVLFPTRATAPTALAGISGVKQVQMGFSMILMLRSDGTVWALGVNESGQLGDGTTAARPTPVQVRGPGGVGFLADVKAIAAGDRFALALLADGTLWAWGNNAYGQLGDGSTTNRLTPVPVNAGAGGVTSIAAGVSHSLAVKLDGTLWAWGYNTFGQLGIGTTANTSAPTQVGGAANWASAAAGYYHTIARRTDGTVWSWGWNFYGELGDGTTTQHTTPVQVGGLGDVQAVAAGYAYSLALKFDGSVWGWGQSPGNGIGVQVASPMQVPGLSGIAGIAAGRGYYASSFALAGDGTLRAWGRNDFGQLGDGSSSTTPHSTPAAVLASGSNERFWMLKDELRPEPFQFASRFGVARGSVANSNPIRIQGLGAASPISVTGGLYSVNGGGFTSAAGTVINGDVVTVHLTAAAAYGAAAIAALTIGPVRAVFFVLTERDPAAPQGVPRIAAGEMHTALLRPDGLVWAWGGNESGQLGNDSTIPASSPQRVAGLADVKQIASGRLHMLALTGDGTVWAWGWNAWGQVGDGTSETNRNLPVQVLGPEGTAVLGNVLAISAGGGHSLAVTADGAVYAWGGNDGQLGTGTFGTEPRPVRVKGPNGDGFLSNVIAVAAGERHSVALAGDGTVWVWGNNAFGQLGDGSYEGQLTPVAVASLGSVAQIAAGSEHTLARKTDGSLWAWGKNSMGQLGNGANVSSGVPVPVPGMASGVTAIAAGNNHTVAVKAGQLYAWGANENGQLGDGGTQARNQPFAVPGMTGIVSVAAGGRHTVALGAASALFAFGDNMDGQVGNRSGNFGIVSNVLNLLRGDLILSQPVPPVSSSVGQSSTTGSAALNHDSLGDSIAFGPVVVGVANAAIPRRFKNGSSKLFQSVSLAIDPPAPGEFAISANGCGAPLAPGAECEYSVAHTAQGAGTRSGEVVVTALADDGQSLTTRVSLASTASVAPGPGVGLSAASLSFGSVSVGQTSASQSVTVTNIGDATLTISAAAVTGAGFAANANSCNAASLPVGQTCTVSIVFSPSTAGAASGALSLTDNAAGSPHTVSLSGVGVVIADTEAPSVPTGFGASTVSASQINLTWDASSDNVGVTVYKVYRGDVLIATLGNVAGFGDTGLAPSSAYSYTVRACDAAGNCSAQSAAALATTPAGGGPSFTPNLSPGWNLLGNSLNITLGVPALFGSATAPVAGVSSNIASIWKWDAANAVWAYHSPQLTAAQIDAFTASKGYFVLSSIGPGEGYWVNTAAPFTLPAQSGAAFTYDSVNYQPLPPSWNLIATAQNVTPTDFANTVSALSPPQPCGVSTADTFVSLWAWDAAQAAWYYYSPVLENTPGCGLTAVKNFAAGKGYLHFQDYAKKLDIGTGFWVNRP